MPRRHRPADGAGGGLPEHAVGDRGHRGQAQLATRLRGQQPDGGRGEGERIERLVSVAGTAYVQKLPPFVTKLRNPSTQLLLQMLPARWIVRQVLNSIVVDPAVVTDELIDGYAAPLRSWAAKRAAARFIRPRHPPASR